MVNLAANHDDFAAVKEGTTRRVASGQPGGTGRSRPWRRTRRWNRGDYMVQSLGASAVLSYVAGAAAADAHRTRRSQKRWRP